MILNLLFSLNKTNKAEKKLAPFPPLVMSKDRHQNSEKHLKQK